jgi:hypothetical protein
VSKTCPAFRIYKDKDKDKSKNPKLGPDQERTIRRRVKTPET